MVLDEDWARKTELAAARNAKQLRTVVPCVAVFYVILYALIPASVFPLLPQSGVLRSSVIAVYFVALLVNMCVVFRVIDMCRIHFNYRLALDYIRERREGQEIV